MAFTQTAEWNGALSRQPAGGRPSDRAVVWATIRASARKPTSVLASLTVHAALGWVLLTRLGVVAERQEPVSRVRSVQVFDLAPAPEKGEPPPRGVSVARRALVVQPKSPTEPIEWSTSTIKIPVFEVASATDGAQPGVPGLEGPVSLGRGHGGGGYDPYAGAAARVTSALPGEQQPDGTAAFALNLSAFNAAIGPLAVRKQSARAPLVLTALVSPTGMVLEIFADSAQDRKAVAMARAALLGRKIFDPIFAAVGPQRIALPPITTKG